MLLWLVSHPVVAAAPPPPIAAVIPASPIVRLTAASGVRARERPEPTAPELTRLPIGQRLDVLRTTTAPVVIGAQEGVWYEVATDKGPGWVYAPLTVVFDPAHPDEAWLAITRARLPALDPMTWSEEADLARFLRRVCWAGQSTSSRAELASAYVQAATAAVRDTDDCESGGPLCRELLRLFPEAVQQDPGTHSGLLYMKDSFLDEVGGLAMGTPFEEQVAWIAATGTWRDELNDLPGVLLFLQDQEEAYLRVAPDGAHVGDVLTRVDNAMDPMWVEQTTWTPELRIEARDDLTRLRAVVDRTHHASKATVLAAIDKELATVGAPAAPLRDGTPMERIQRFYGIGDPAARPPTAPVTGEEPPLSRALDIALHHTACWEGVPYPGFDYTVAGQDAQLTELSARQIPSAQGATVEVRFRNFGTPTTVRWDLIQEEGEWRVATVRGESGDQRYDLAADALGATGRCDEMPGSP